MGGVIVADASSSYPNVAVQAPHGVGGPTANYQQPQLPQQRYEFANANAHFGIQYQPYQHPMSPTQGTYSSSYPTTTIRTPQEPRGMHTVTTHPMTPSFDMYPPVGTAPSTSSPHTSMSYEQHMYRSPVPSNANYGPVQGTPRTQNVSRPMQPAPAAPVQSSRISEELPQPAGSTSAASTAGFPCKWSRRSRCPVSLEGDKNSVARHLRDYHGFVCDGEAVACAWEQCGISLQRRNVARHIVACHLEVKVYCKSCGIPLSRPDAGKKHEKYCTKGDTQQGGSANHYHWM